MVANASLCLLVRAFIFSFSTYENTLGIVIDGLIAAIIATLAVA